MSERPHVVVLGCGFGGMGAIHRLGDAAVDITLIDQNDYHTFQPLLYQVATAELDASTVGYPIRDLLHKHNNLRFHQAMVTGVDLENKTVEVEGMTSIAYDYLLIALGAQVNYFGVPGAAEHAFPLYSLKQAVQLKSHILETLDAADRDPSLIEDGAMNVVVVGGGPTGVETAGALTDLFSHEFSQDYPNLPIDKARIILVDAGPALLGPFKEKLQQYTMQTVEKLGVELHMKEHVVEVTPDSATLKSGDPIKTRTVIWAAGLQACPVVRSLGVELGRGGRVPVEADLSLAAHPEVFVVGDNALATDANTNKVMPQLGSVAIQCGTHAGENILKRIEATPTEPFRYHDKGTMATIGRDAAVVELPGGMTLTGEVAWLAWGAVHLALLTGVESRASALVDWSWALFTHHRSKRIHVDA